MKNTQKLKEEGLISIISTIIIIVIITVITLSLSVLSRRELRQALDEQLSSQALYAAESGVNDAIAKINSDSPPGTVSTCDKTGSAAGAVFPSNTLGGNIRYTCVLIDDSPGEITTDVSQGKMKAYKLYSGGPNFQGFTFKWSGQGDEVPKDCSTAGSCLTSQTEWSANKRMGLLRVRLFKDDFTPVQDIIAYPGKITNSSADATISGFTSKVLYADCDSTVCRVYSTELKDATGQYANANTYYVQIYSYYGDIKVTVNGLGAGGASVSFIGAQTTIDATGAAGDVLKRIKVTVPAKGSSSLPPYVLSSAGDLCKRFTTNATSTTDVGATATPSCSAF